MKSARRLPAEGGRQAAGRGSEAQSRGRGQTRGVGEVQGRHIPGAGGGQRARRERCAPRLGGPHCTERHVSQLAYYKVQPIFSKSQFCGIDVAIITGIGR